MGKVGTDIELDEKVLNNHRVDSLNILLYTFLLILTVVTIWIFKYRRLRYVHETGLGIVYGLIVGAILRYSGDTTSISHIKVQPTRGEFYNESLPPDTLWFHYTKVKLGVNRTYIYILKSELPKDLKENEIVEKRHFFKNLGAIFSYAFLGTTISTFVVGGIVYSFMWMIGDAIFTFIDCLLFGALISATDPVTVLAIFNDLHVDVNLYALVFGESVLNDAVAIVLSSAIESYGSNRGGFETKAFFLAILNFAWIFSMSFVIGSVMGCLTAILTKFTRLRDFPLLESALFVLMSYSTFLMSEAAGFTGIVAVLFCGICQAHYTFNNLSPDSRLGTKSLFELLNFLSENFIFSYIGVSMFTFENHRWQWDFICISFIAIIIGRFLNIYPLSFIMNLARTPKIPKNFMNMLFFSGLRGAIAFALAIRNTGSDARKAIYTTTSLIVIITVMLCGGLTTQVLMWLGIPVNVEEEELHHLNQFQLVSNNYKSVVQEMGPPVDTENAESPHYETLARSEKAWLFRVWSQFDVRYMKPMLTNSRPTLLDTTPLCCAPLARLLTTTDQLTQDRDPLDDDLPLDDQLLSSMGTRTAIDISRQNITNQYLDGDLGLGTSGIIQTRVSVPGSHGHDI